MSLSIIIRILATDGDPRPQDDMTWPTSRLRPVKFEQLDCVMSYSIIIYYDAATMSVTRGGKCPSRPS